MSDPNVDGGGLRYDAGKNRVDLIPSEWIFGLGEVLTAGAAKYAERNWERGMKWSKMVGCTTRHLLKFICGEKYDIGPGGTRCHHLLLAAWNILALFSYDVRGIGENDLVGSMKWLSACRLDELPAQSEQIKKQAFREAGWRVDSDYDEKHPAMYGVGNDPVKSAQAGNYGTWGDKGGI